MFISGSFFPSVPAIARDLDSSGSVIRWVFFLGHRQMSHICYLQPCGQLVGPCNEHWLSSCCIVFEFLYVYSLDSPSESQNRLYPDGRRPVYLVGLPLLCVGSLGVALSQTVSQLMVWRFLQTFGASPGLSVGAGVIGDIYKLEERGGAMGIFFGVRSSAIQTFLSL